ncbi:hypothetical protein A0U91_14545 (plasmid) [Acetobacter persici]|uniref:Uncharacterized protein n=1 Tax=Acetobacter persici TaxID=1076596 RepID=A0A1U9LIG1_9PROT|nr:hypothetical protein A0U91_14545 [Acetobacter persici]
MVALRRTVMKVALSCMTPPDKSPLTAAFLLMNASKQQFLKDISLVTPITFKRRLIQKWRYLLAQILQSLRHQKKMLHLLDPVTPAQQIHDQG